MNLVKNPLKIASYIGIAKISGLMKVSFLVGSQMVWFSASNAVLPLAGAFGGVAGSGLVFLIRQLIHLLFFKTISLSFLAFCVPGLCASLYWATQHYTIRLLLPLMCMVLFVIHPVGAEAFVYSLYWLIFVILFFIKKKSLFLEALGSTFIAHAVGSVIWLYTVPMAATTWVALMPLVLFERIAFALGMVIVHYMLSSIFNLIDKASHEKKYIMGSMHL
ncbi:MAG TPA: hypothetical protein VHX42_00365 [Candidatus Babeliales bacterium]|nr:hypothetical protein [Candidatus Babeliales bacterium]